MATVIVDGGGGGQAAKSNTGLWIAITGIATAGLLFFSTSAGVEADALYWYELGQLSAKDKATAIQHLTAMEKTATGSALTLIQGYLKSLGASTTTKTTKKSSTGSGS